MDYLHVYNPRLPLDQVQLQLLQTHRSFDHILVVFSDQNDYEDLPWTASEKKAVKQHLKDVFNRVPGLLINASRLGPITFAKAEHRSFSGETSGTVVRLSNLFFDEQPHQQLFTVIHELTHAVDCNQKLSYSEEWQKLVTGRIVQCRCDFLKAKTWLEKADVLQRYRVPSDYALSNSTEFLADCVAAVALCPDNNCSPDIRAFIQKYILAKQPKPDAYDQALHRIVTDKGAQSFAKAEALCDDWLRKRPDDLMLTRLRMQIRGQRCHFEGCAADGRRVLELARDLPEYELLYIDCYSNLGYSYFNLKRYKECLPYFDKLLAHGKQYAIDQISRGYAYLYLNRPALALQDFNEVLSREPDSLKAELGRVRVFARMWMTDKAYAELDKLRKRERPTKEVFWQLADLELAEGKKRLAEHHMLVAAQLAE